MELGLNPQFYAAQLFFWGVIWAALLLIPPGPTAKESIARLSFVHSSLCSVVAIVTLLWFTDLLSVTCTAITVAFFLVDGFNMVLRDIDRIQEYRREGRKERAINMNRLMEYTHHGMGIVFGTIFTFDKTGILSYSPNTNMFTMCQVHEISTPFYNWYRMSRSKLSGICFALTFFFARIVYSAIQVWRVQGSLSPFGKFLIVIYLSLQVGWFGMIVKKVIKTIKKGNASKIEKEAETSSSAKSKSD